MSTKEDEVHIIGCPGVLEAEAKLAKHMQLQPQLTELNAKIERLTAAVRPHGLLGYENLERLRVAPEYVRAQFRELRQLSRELTDINRGLMGDEPYNWEPDEIDDELGRSPS